MGTQPVASRSLLGMQIAVSGSRVVISHAHIQGKIIVSAFFLFFPMNNGIMLRNPPGSISLYPCEEL